MTDRVPATLVRANVPWRAVTGAVIVGIDGELIKLAGTTAALWNRLDRPRDVEELIAGGETDVAAAHRALDELQRHGLVLSS